MPKSQKAFLVGKHRFCFHPGEPAEILGVRIVTPEDHPPRPCFHVRFENGDEDFVPLSDKHYFSIISEDDVKFGNIPAAII